MPQPLAPPDNSASKVVTPKTADDINDLLNEEIPEEKVEKPERKTKPVEQEEEKEEKEAKPEIDEETDEDELELAEPEEEEDKLDLEAKDDLAIETPPRKKEILKKYPNVFKDFPFLEKMMFRDREYTNLFGSFDDAREAAEKSEALTNLEGQLMQGNTVELLKEIKDSDSHAFDVIVDEYLPNLAKVDKDAYFHVVNNLNRRLIMEMVEEAKTSGNEDLQQAALLVHQFIFGNSKFTAPSRRTEKLDEKKSSEAEAERLEFVRERFESVRDDLQVQVDNTLRATISEYIDPKGQMSPYEKKNAVADAMRMVSQAIAGDQTTTNNLDKLWRASFADKFSRDSQGRIKSYYLSRGKAALKNAIIKARTEALKDKPLASREKRNDEEETESRTQRRVIPTGRPSQPRGKNEMKKGESVTDFFMRD